MYILMSLLLIVIALGFFRFLQHIQDVEAQEQELVRLRFENILSAVKRERDSGAKLGHIINFNFKEHKIKHRMYLQGKLDAMYNPKPEYLDEYFDLMGDNES